MASPPVFDINGASDIAFAINNVLYFVDSRFHNFSFFSAKSIARRMNSDIGIPVFMEAALSLAIISTGK